MDLTDATLLPHEDQDAALDAVRAQRGRDIHLMPIICELKILTKERGVVRLGDVMNHAQVDFITRCEGQLRTRGQIRACVLKARQIGLSTIIEAILFSLSILFDDFKSLIISHEDKSAAAILAMTKRYWSTYAFKRFHAERYNGQKHLAWASGSDMDVATAKNVGAGRSQTIHGLHGSEVAFWPDPETLMTGLRQSVPTYGLTCIFLESTANGVGNYFHTQCTRAMKGETEFEFFFYPWFEHPEYTAAFIPDDELTKNQLTMLDEEELRLRDAHGISDARLVWRRWAITNLCQGSIDKFHQEYPTTPHEAFISTGRNVFPLPKLLDHYEPLHGVRGRLIRRGRRVEFIEDPQGWLTMFVQPTADRDWGVYLAGADPTHTTAGDYACIQVLNRRTLEQVAVYRRKIGTIGFAADLLLVGQFYNDAMIAPEREGPGYATVGAVVASNYPNVYQHQNVTKAQGKVTGLEQYGWSTNSQTKHLAMAYLLQYLMEPLVQIGEETYGLLIHDQTTLLEMRDYVTTLDGGSYENSDGSEYDDGVMALAIAAAVNRIEPPPPAYEERDLASRVADMARRGGKIRAAGVTTGHGRVDDLRPEEVRVGTKRDASRARGRVLRERDETETHQEPAAAPALVDGTDDDAYSGEDWGERFDDTPIAPWEEAWGTPRDEVDG